MTKLYKNLSFITIILVSIIIALSAVNGFSEDLSQANKDLFSAIHSKDINALKKALENGADINGKDFDGIPPLIWSIIYNDSKSVRLLLEHGADVYADFNGSNALACAAGLMIHGHNIMELLLHYIGAYSIENYLYALQSGDYVKVDKMVKEFLKLGINIINSDIKYENNANTIIPEKLRASWFQNRKVELHVITGLYIAAKEGYTKIVKLLCDNGALNVPTIFTEHGGLPKDFIMGPSALIAAAANGHTDIVEFFIDKGADIDGVFYWPNSNDKEEFFSETPLMWAAVKGHVDVVKLLISKGADVNKLPNLYYMHSYFPIEKMKEDNADFDSNTITGPLDSHPALILAAMEGHADIVRLLLNAGADVNIQDRYDNTALIMASENGHTETVKLLLNAGANINTGNYTGYTALMLAAKNGKADIVRLLIKYGADSSVTSFALSLAAREGHSDVVRLLIAKGVDVNEAEKNNFVLTRAIYAGQAEVVKLLIESGIKNEKVIEKAQLLLKRVGPIPNIRLWNAVRQSNYNRTLDVVKNGADVNAQIHKNTPVFGPRIEYQYRTPLSVASDLGDYEIAKLLIESGADVNAVFPNGATALHFAVGNGHADIVKLLIEKGANTQARMTQGMFNGMTPLMYAEATKHTKICNILRNAGAKSSEELFKITNNFLESAKSGDIKTVKNALQEGIDINLIRKDGSWPGVTALILASGEGHTDIVKYLIEKGADVNTKMKFSDFSGCTALMLASSKGHTDIVQILLKNGAKADEKVSGGKMAGESALSFAKYNNHRDIVQLLIQAGGNSDDLPDISPYIENGNKSATIWKMKEIGFVLYASSEKSDITEVSKILEGLPSEYYYDVWGTPIMYQSDGRLFKLISYGRDRVPGGRNFDEDIVISEINLVPGEKHPADSLFPKPILKAEKYSETPDNSIIKVSGIDLHSVFRRLRNAGFNPGSYQKDA